jgi:hypothetical protein
MLKVVAIVFSFSISLFLNQAFSQVFESAAIGENELNAEYIQNKESNAFQLKITDIPELNLANEFYFVYTKVAGDFKFSAQTNYADCLNSQNRFGLMVRNSVAPNSVFGEIGLQDAQTTRKFKTILNTGGGSSKKRCLFQSKTNYIELERKSDTLFYRVSSETDDIKLYGINIMDLKDTVLVGMFLKPDLILKANETEFRNVILIKNENPIISDSAE